MFSAFCSLVIMGRRATMTVLGVTMAVVMMVSKNFFLSGKNGREDVVCMDDVLIRH